MRYNSVSLPGIPVYDEVIYPYACIAESSLVPGVFTLYICSAPFCYSAATGNVRTAEGARLNTSKLDSDTKVWGMIRNADNIAGSTGLRPMWCNVDILDEEGGVYLAGSAPVREPKEIVGYFRCVNWLVGFVLGLGGKPIPAGDHGHEGS